MQKSTNISTNPPLKSLLKGAQILLLTVVSGMILVVQASAQSFETASAVK